MTQFNEYGRLSRVLLHPAHVAFGGGRIERQWRALNFTAPPDLGRASEQYAAFRELIAASGAQLDELSDAGELTLDAIYVRDASIVSPRGIIVCRMGKPLREAEPAAQRRAFEALGAAVAGAIQPPGQLEGGDVVWFDERTVAIGRGYRTNNAGIAQFRALVGQSVDVVVVALPHHRGPGDVFHLMSVLSPVDHDLAVVYSPLMPVSFRERLLDRAIRLVEVPPDEFDAMGTNVLAVAPRLCVMLNNVPVTRARLEAAGAEVWTYDGSEISAKGGGGPTCLTRPLARE
ncbi:MAG TPA: arginine deiminase family protein [Vicinamibacterales bacterium]|nr:arginine deiminase family protein [Vicinamibacterales bacterium]